MGHTDREAAGAAAEAAEGFYSAWLLAAIREGRPGMLMPFPGFTGTCSVSCHVTELAERQHRLQTQLFLALHHNARGDKDAATAALSEYTQGLADVFGREMAETV